MRLGCDVITETDLHVVICRGRPPKLKTIPKSERVAISIQFSIIQAYAIDEEDYIRAIESMN